MKYNKEDLEKLILFDKLSYREIGKKYGVCDAYIKKVAKKLGIILPVRSVFPENYVPHNKDNKHHHYCKNCNSEINKKQQFCGKKCSAEYKGKEHYQHYLSHQEDFKGSLKVMRFVKKYILLEQDCKCAICHGENVWNNKPLIFVLDHIDGDASNNQRKNLRLICSNCDSQLDTYKSKNKNSARKNRYLLNYKN